MFSVPSLRNRGVSRGSKKNSSREELGGAKAWKMRAVLCWPRSDLAENGDGLLGDDHMKSSRQQKHEKEGGTGAISSVNLRSIETGFWRKVCFMNITT